MDHIYCTCNGSLPPIVDSVSSYLADGYFFSTAYKNSSWDGRVRYVKYAKRTNTTTFPTGFLTRITAVLDKFGHSYQLIDNREFPDVEPCLELYDNKLGTIRLDTGRYSYQSEVLQQALAHGRGIIKMATGLGKSKTAAAIIRSIGGKAIWLTHRLNLAHQTKGVLEESLRCKVGLWCGTDKYIEDVTVGLVQSLVDGSKAIKDHMRSCRVLIGDELHRAEGGTYFDTLAQIPAPYRFGLSATPELDGVGLNLLATTGDVIADIPVSEGIRRGVLVPPRIWVCTIKEPKKITGTYQAVYRQGVVENEHRNDQIVRICSQLAKDKKPTLLLVKQISHGENLNLQLQRIGVASAFVCGKTKNDVRQEYIKQLIDGRLNTLVAVTEIMSEGTDIPQLKAVVNASGTKAGGADNDGGRQLIQILGRGLRASEGKTYFDMIDFFDSTNKFLKKASEDRLETYIAQGYSDYVDDWDNYQ